MTRPTRATPAGEAYLALQNMARRTGRATQELQQLYVLEGFLARLAASDVRDQFVLKGGVLLAAFDVRRPTKDVDLAALAVSSDPQRVCDLVAHVVAIDPDVPDGLWFDAENVRGSTIRDEEDYSGIRVHVHARLATARLAFHIDVNVGDPIWPAPQLVRVPRLRSEVPIEVLGYPITMVYAEKIVTALQRGIANTRWRDFADVWTLMAHHPVESDDLARAMDVVARHRGATLRPLGPVLDGYAALGQARWAAWRRRSNSDHVPVDFSKVLGPVIGFADPILNGQAQGYAWSPDTQTWVGPERE